MFFSIVCFVVAKGYEGIALSCGADASDKTCDEARSDWKKRFVDDDEDHDDEEAGVSRKGKEGLSYKSRAVLLVFS